MSCKLCQKIYNETNRLPKLIPQNGCEHTFCLQCIQMMKRCYVCSTPFNQTDCRTNKESLEAAKKLGGGDIDHRIKFCFGGSSGVGKTSLIKRLKGQDFSPVMNSTCGVESSTMKKLIDNSIVKVTFQDAIGQEQYRSICRSFDRGCKVFVLVYDLSADQNSNDLGYWLTDIQQYGPEDTMIILVGNKLDQIEGRDDQYSRSIRTTQLERLLDMKAMRARVSCKTNEGMQELWQKLDLLVDHHLQKIRQKQKQAENALHQEQRKRKEEERQQKIIKLEVEVIKNRAIQSKKHCQC